MQGRKVDTMNAKAKTNVSAESAGGGAAAPPIPSLLSQHPFLTGMSAPHPPIPSLVSQHPFLTGMSAHQLRILSDCAMQSHFEANELIFREGDPADRFYLINRGRIALESQTNRGRKIIQNIGAGDVLGWSWL